MNNLYQLCFICKDKENKDKKGGQQQTKCTDLYFKKQALHRREL